MAVGEAAQEGAQGGGGQNAMPQHRLGGPRPQGVAVINAVAAGEGRVNQRHRFVAHVGVPGSIAEVHVVVEQLTQAEVLGQRGRQDQTGIADQAPVVEGHGDGVEAVG